MGYYMKNNNRGFSLVELSIVLVILGLLTGGVLAGQSLIKAAELRSITTEYTSFQIAVNTFKNKYFQIPGDMTNATSFWGDNATHCADAGITDGTPGTCSGDGDGFVAQQAAAASQEAEGYMFWQHLSNAGLVEGNFTGLAGSGGVFDDESNENVPGSEFNGGCWSLDTENAGTGTNFDVPLGPKVSSGGAYYNLLSLGADSTTGDCDEKVMTPEDAWNLDTKMDDGKPAYGSIIARFWDDCTDATTNLITDSDYLLTDSTEQCALYFTDILQ